MRRQVGPQSFTSCCRYTGNDLPTRTRRERRVVISRPAEEGARRSGPARGVGVVGALGGLGVAVAGALGKGPAVGADVAELAVAADLHLVLVDLPQLAEL